MPVVPSKPQSGRYSISELTRIINSIIDYLRNSKLRPGNGIKISETATSILISAETAETAENREEQELTSVEYDGPFAVNLTENMLRVNPGFASCNGTFIPVSGKTIAARTGYLCVETELLTDSGIWKQPVVNFSTPDRYHFPIAYISAGEEAHAHVKIAGVSLQLQAFQENLFRVRIKNAA